MGGIVGAETLILLSHEQPIRQANDSESPAADDKVDSFMFPHIQGLLAFDTPFLGIAPGAVSHTAEGQYRTVANTISDVAGVLGFGWGKNEPQGENRNASPSGDVAATPSWQRWGRYAMFAGAIGAATAGGAAAVYQQRQNIAGGLNWVSSHLEFVGCLARPAELRERLELLGKIARKRGIRSSNLYTRLGKGSQSLQEKRQRGNASFTERIIRSNDRTFCNLPDGDGTGGVSWIEAVNHKAGDEVKAHTCMFLPDENPGLHTLVLRACDVVVSSVDRHWYASSSGPADTKQQTRTESTKTRSDSEDGFMDVSNEL